MNKLFFIFLLLISVKSTADVYETGKINALKFEGSSLVIVWVEGPGDKSECSNGHFWTLHSSDALFKEKVSLLLTAYSTNTPVELRHLSGWNCGTWNSNKIYSIKV